MIAVVRTLLLLVIILNTTNGAVEEKYENPSITITGDLSVWDAIFSSRAAPTTIINASHDNHNLIWTEGPTLVGDELFFSDTVGDKIYALDVSSFSGNHGGGDDDDDDDDKKSMLQLRVVRERSGDNPLEDDDWRAEPGSNGLFLLPPLSDSSKTLLVCQHGARRVAALDISAPISAQTIKKEEAEAATPAPTIPLASEWNGRKLNGPNDIVIRHENNDKMYAYFTDPVYAWQEKDRFADLPYLDDKVQSKDGPGHCGVYRFELSWEYGDDNTGSSPWSRVGDVELLQVMDRPNGIGFLNDVDDADGKSSKLIVSDCCQGSHLDGCKQGTSRWTIFQQNNEGNWVKDALIERIIEKRENELYGLGGGCADGFAIHQYVDNVTVDSSKDNETKKMKRALLASCSEGLCIVDLEQNKVVARLWMLKKSGCKVSNVAIGNGWAYLTGNCGILGLPLRGEHQLNHGETLAHTEL